MIRYFGVLLLAATAWPQESVTIHVDASQTGRRFYPVWAYFGYDEPNYTYAENGRKLLKELSELSREPVKVRTHNLLTTGDGVAALKWGSTNAYTEDASGKPVYNWTIVDKILDTYLSTGIKPFVEIGFMPKATLTFSLPTPKAIKRNGNSAGFILSISWPVNVVYRSRLAESASNRMALLSCKRKSFYGKTVC